MQRNAHSSQREVYRRCVSNGFTHVCPGTQKWEGKELEDLAYFEPYYLKDFIATVPRKKLL
ncbi:MAG: hypothetical protein HC896_02050 [Bacteroidales bacterium]|nr:hypothetical protein [Bacteroidales bacterium]